MSVNEKCKIFLNTNHMTTHVLCGAAVVDDSSSDSYNGGISITHSRIVCRILMLMLVTAVMCGMGMGMANAAIITVDDSDGAMYTSIQTAVNAASSGDEIHVHSGTYYENVNVTKRLTLRGMDTGDGMPEVDAGGSGSVITLSADGIILEGFRATNAGSYPNAGIKVMSSNNTLSGNTASNNARGIWLSSSNNNTLRDNTLIENGLFVYNSYKNNIVNNTINGKILVYLEDKFDIIIQNAGQVILVNSSNITVEGLNLSNASIGIELWNTNDCKIINNTVSNNRYGTYLYYSNNNTLIGNAASNNTDGIDLYYSSNNMLIDNTISNNTDDGIWLSSSSNNTLSGNAIPNNTYGIWLSSSSNNTLIGNTISNNTDGIDLYYSSNNTLSGNTISNNTDGIWLTSSSNNTLSGNTVSNNTNGIYLLFSCNNNMLSGNMVYNNTDDGISLFFSCNNNTIIDNTATNNTNGIYLYSSSNNTLSDNTVSNNADGIYLSYSSNNTLSGNMASRNIDGIFLSSSSNNTLTDNNASLNTDVGIYLYSSSDNTLTNNNASLNTWAGIILSSSSDNTLTNNNASLNTDVGIILSTSSNNTLTNNNASLNTWTGIFLPSSSDNTLTNNNASLNTDVGIFLSSSSNNTLTNNNASLNTWAGIVVYSSSDNTLTDNNASLNTDVGIVVSSSSNNTLTDNNASLNTWYGIVVYSSSDNTLTNNNASNNAYFGIFLIEAYGNNLTGNRADLNLYYDFIQYRSEDNINDEFYYNYTEITRGLRFSINEEISPSAQAIAFENATYRLDIANMGLVNDTYSFEISNPDKANVDLDMYNIFLEPGQRANITVDVSGAHPGGYSVSIDATSISDANITEHIEMYTIVTGVVTTQSVKKMIAEPTQATSDIDYFIMDSLKINSTVSLSVIDHSVLKEAIVIKSRVYNSTIINSTISGLILENALVENNSIIYGNITINGIKYAPSNIPISDIIMGYDQKKGSLVGMASTGKNIEVEAFTSNVSFSISTTKDFFAGSLSVQRSKVPPEGVLLDNDNMEYLTIEASKNLQNGSGWRYMKVYYSRDMLDNRDETTLNLQYFNESSKEWKSISDSGVNTIEGYVWGNISHFSTFALATKKMAPESHSSGSGSGNKLGNRLVITKKSDVKKEDQIPKEVVQMDVASSSQISNPDNIRPETTDVIPVVAAAAAPAPASQSSQKNIPGFEIYVGLACLFVLRYIRRGKT